jgi:hypothetical protein
MVNGVMTDIPLNVMSPVVSPSLGDEKLSQSDKSVILSGAKHGEGVGIASHMSWIGSADLAAKLASANREPYLLYFCSEKIAPLAGEGHAAWDAFKKEHAGITPEATLFENEPLVGCFQGEGLRLFVKVPRTDDNRALFEKFNATEDTLLIMDPDGKKLGSYSGQDISLKKVHAYIHGEFHRQSLAWKKSAPAKTEEAKAPAKDAAGNK